MATDAAREKGEYDRGSSGSSAGSASATAAGLVGFSLGTETLGSIVSPSTACGTVGLRPTYGRVSRHGAMALSWTMDKIGPICRGVEDCALVLNAIYGPDGHDRTRGRRPVPLGAAQAAQEPAVGVLQKDFDRMQGDQKKIYDQALADLKKAGVTMTPVEYQEDLTGIRFLLEAEGAAAFDDITRDGQVRTLRGQGAGDWPNTFRSSRLIPAVEYIRAQRVRTLLVREVREVHGGLGRDRDAAQLRSADHHQSHRQSAGGDEVRLHRTQTSRSRVHRLPRQDLRRGLAAAGGAGLRAGHRVAQEESDLIWRMNV